MKHSMIGCLAVLALAACGADAPQMPEGEVTELTIVDEQVGNGATAVPGSVAVVRNGPIAVAHRPVRHPPAIGLPCEHLAGAVDVECHGCRRWRPHAIARARRSRV